MKKILALLLATSMLLLSIAACSSDSEESSGSGADDSNITESDTEPDAGSDMEPDTGSDSNAELTEDDDNSNTGSGEPSADVSLATSDLEDIIYACVDGIDPDNLPSSLAPIVLDADTFEPYAFIPYSEGYEGLAYEPMISSMAWSVVLVRVPDGTDVESVAADMKANCDPRKWICVDAEIVETYTNGNVAILIMFDSDQDPDTAEANSETIVANFQALNP